MTAEEVRELRALWSFSREDFSYILGVHNNTVYLWEKNGLSRSASVLSMHLLHELRMAWQNTPAPERPLLAEQLRKAAKDLRCADAVYLILQANR